MKLQIRLSSPTETVPFDYMYRLVGVFHYWLGQNELHSNVSLYSLGWLTGGRMLPDASGLEFPQGAKWEIGILDPTIMETLKKGIALKPMVFFGMKVEKVEQLNAPDFQYPKFTFQCASPVLIRHGSSESDRSTVTFDSPDSGLLLSKFLDRKLKDAGLSMYIGTYALYFDPAFKSAKTKLVKYKNGSFMTNVCPVVCVGPAAVKKFLWTVGAGELTGSGFGAMSVGSLPATRPINQRPSSSQFIRKESTTNPIAP